MPNVMLKHNLRIVPSVIMSAMHSALVKDLRKLLGGGNVISAPSELAVYDGDAYAIERAARQAAVFPRSARNIAEIVRICHRNGAAVVPRGAGTSLVGGCLPRRDRPDFRANEKGTVPLPPLLPQASS